MTPFTVFYCDYTQADAWLNSNRLLALIRFDTPVTAHPDSYTVRVALPELGGTTTAEVWLGAQPVQTGAVNGVQYADSGEVLFLQLAVDETTLDTLSPLTTTAYRQLFAAARAQGYPHVLRIWNYFSAINQESKGLERYRAFCIGRHLALLEELTEFETQLPAASAIGTQRSGLWLYALASRESGIQIENPRQISAFRYPCQYGPHSPSFSRAILKRWGPQDTHLYLSGTASVVGHASLHLDLMAQLDETLINLNVLLAEASLRISKPLHLALLRVYLRSDLDPEPLQARIVQAFGATVPLLFLRADICRRELLIEIEGLATSAAVNHDQDTAL